MMVKIHLVMVETNYLLILYHPTAINFQVINSEDVISQLLIRTYNENGTLKENTQKPNDGAVSSKEDAPAGDAVKVQISGGTMRILKYKEPIAVQTTLSQEGTGSMNNTTHNILETMELGNAEIAISIPNIVAEQSKDASLVDDASKDMHNSTTSSTKQNPSKQDELPSSKSDENRSLLIRSQKNKPTNHVRKQVLNESALLNDSNATDPLEFSNDLTCTDEFINTDLLDSPNFLKNLTSNSSNASICKNDTAITCDKTEDSDIEILENIENSKVAEEKNVEKKNVENVADQTTEQLQSSTVTETETEEQSEDITDDKSTSQTVANSDNTATWPLTLEDIKDTGFTGLDLYKCGYMKCNFAATAAPLLKKHIKECNYSLNEKNLHCAHCAKRFIKIGFLLEHLKLHGLKRFGCSLCKVRYPVPYQATAHMKTKHKFPNTKLVPADPTNPSIDGLFIVQAIVSPFLITNPLSI